MIRMEEGEANRLSLVLILNILFKFIDFTLVVSFPRMLFVRLSTRRRCYSCSQARVG